MEIRPVRASPDDFGAQAAYIPPIRSLERTSPVNRYPRAYCGSRSGRNAEWREAAAALGAGLAERGIEMVYGGGNVGLMGVAADAAMAAGGRVVGIIPRDLEAREQGHRAVSELHVVDSMHERKLLMAKLSDAFVSLPGGLGTLDETFEILTWRQLRFHDKPIVLADIGGYWQPLLDLLDAQVASGFVAPAHLALLTVVRSVDEIFTALEGAGESAVAFKVDKA